MNPDDLELDADSDSDERESGPYCRHWSDPCGCEEKCAKCGHRCGKHRDSESCDEPDCNCTGWEEAP